MRLLCNIGLNERTCFHKNIDNYKQNLLYKSLSFSQFDPVFWSSKQIHQLKIGIEKKTKTKKKPSFAHIKCHSKGWVQVYLNNMLQITIGLCFWDTLQVKWQEKLHENHIWHNIKGVCGREDSVYSTLARKDNNIQLQH